MKNFAYGYTDREIDPRRSTSGRPTQCIRALEATLKFFRIHTYLLIELFQL